MSFRKINSADDVLNWNKVSEAIEKADSEHCKNLDKFKEEREEEE